MHHACIVMVRPREKHVVVRVSYGLKSRSAGGPFCDASSGQHWNLVALGRMSPPAEVTFGRSLRPLQNQLTGTAAVSSLALSVLNLGTNKLRKRLSAAPHDG